MKNSFLCSLALGFVLASGCASAAGTATPPAPSTSNPQIRIVSPRDSGIVPAGSNTVKVAVENAAPNKAHSWQLYLDGVLINQNGSGVLSSTVTISASGPHEIRATLTDDKNVELSSASIEVTAAPETPTASPFNLPWVAPAMAVLVIAVLAMIGFGLRITRDKKWLPPS